MFRSHKPIKLNEWRGFKTGQPIYYRRFKGQRHISKIKEFYVSVMGYDCAKFEDGWQDTLDRVTAVSALEALLLGYDQDVSS